MSQAEVDLAISGMTCASCVARVEKKLNKLPGVTAVVNLATEKAHVEITEGGEAIDDDALVATVVKAGYGATVLKRVVTDEHGTKAIEAGSNAEEAEAAAARAAASRVSDLRVRFWVALVLSTPVVAISMVPAWQFAGWQWVIGALSLPVAFWSGWPFLRAAFRAGRHGSTTMDTLVSLGILASMGWSIWALLFGGAGKIGYTMAMTGIHGLGHSGLPHVYFESAAFIVTFLLLGRWLESRSRRSAGDALRSLLDLGAGTATRVMRADGTPVEETIPATQLNAGDVFLVRPGETIATDGVILEGSSAVDASLLTGESVPVDVTRGDSVTGATINSFGALRVCATRVGEETTLAQMGRLLTEAQTGKAAVQRLADRISAIFVPTVISIAVATFVIRLIIGNPAEMALASAITVLVVACPCALGLATPTALLVGSSRASRLGILIKGPEILESAHGADTIILDKTGTLTTGVMEVSEVHPVSGVSTTELVSIAAGIEKSSEHPIARAITSYAERNDIEASSISDVMATAGRGISGTLAHESVVAGTPQWLADLGISNTETTNPAGVSIVAVARDHAFLGVIAVGDTLRAESRETITQLKAFGITPVLVTGDNASAAHAIAHQAGITDVRAGVLPEGKLAVIEEFKKSGHRVAMVGDGVNDAAALAAADLSIAMGSGTDVAKAASDITIVNSEIRSVASALRISQATLRIIKQNLGWAFGYNLVAIPIAILGFIVPGIAAAAMASSSVIVVGNSLRLRAA